MTHACLYVCTCLWFLLKYSILGFFFKCFSTKPSWFTLGTTIPIRCPTLGINEALHSPPFFFLHFKAINQKHLYTCIKIDVKKLRSVGLAVKKKRLEV